MRIPDHIVEQIKVTADADLLGVISDFLALKKKGRTYEAKSPFAKEKTPSFKVSPEKHIWKCFSSGEGGRGAVSFLMSAQGMSFLEAIRHLASKYSIAIPERDEAPAYEQEYQLLKSVAQQYQLNLDELANTGTQYIIERSISIDSVEKFQIGFAPEAWRFLEFDQAALQKAEELGVIKKNSKGHYDVFRTRIIFPIQDAAGRIVGFGGRTLSKDKDVAKYINSPESAIYKKSELLYGLNHARLAIRQGGRAILTEGYTDVVMLHQHGIENVVASCGTALTEQQARLLQRYTNQVLIIRDADKAGIKAACKDIDILVGSGLAVKVLLLPEGDDPDSFVRREGAKAFHYYAESNAIDCIGFLIDQEAKGQHLDDPQVKSRILKRVGATLASMPFETEQQLYVEHVAARMNVKPNLVAKFAGILKDVFLASDKSAQGIRTWDDYQSILKTVGANESPDFSRAADGGVLIAYKTLKGDPFQRTANKQKTDVIRITTQSGRPHGVYIPQALRDLSEAAFLEAIKKGLIPLVLVKDEITAHILCELGMPALGMNHRDSFLSKSNEPKLHPLLQEVLNYFGFKRIIYVMPAQAWQLPPEQKVDDTEHDAARFAIQFLHTLIDLEKSTRDYQIFVVADRALDPDIDMAWLDLLLLSNARQEVILEMKTIFDPKYKPKHFRKSEITAWPPASIRKLLKIDSPTAFYKLHGYGKLGKLFRFGKKVYEVDRHGTPLLKDDDEPAPEVWTSGKVMKCRAKGEGVKRISNFVIECELEIKEMDDSFGIYIFENDLGQKCRTIISDSDFLSLTSFTKKVRALPGKFFPKMTTNHLPEIQEMTNIEADLATTLGHKLGMYQPMPDVEGGVPEPFFVWGNGISSIAGEFITSDENGMLEHDSRKYFLPANCSFLAMRPGHIEKYQKNYMMTYQAGDVSFRTWFDQFAKVNGEVHAHIAFQFALSALYIDQIGKHFGRFPLYYVQGRRGSGKGTMIESLARLWGLGGITDKSEGLDIMNLESDNTLASIFYHPTQVKNALCVYNEFNVSTITKKMPKVLEFFKGIYDRQGRKRMSGSNTKETEEAAIEGVVVFMGQEAIYKRDELDSRCIIDEFPDREAPTSEETQRLYDLYKIEEKGLSQMVSTFFSYRPLIEANIKAYVRQTEVHLKDAGQEIKQAPARLFQNWALLLSPLFILIDQAKIDYPLSKKALLELAIDNITHHVANTQEQGKAGLFFQFIEEAVMKAYSGIDDRTVYVDHNADELRIQFRNAYNLFDSWLHATRRSDSLQNTTQKDMQHYLESHPAFLKTEKKNLHIGYKRDESGLIAITQDGTKKKNRTSGMIFRYSLLDIEINQAAFTFEDRQDVPAPENGQHYEMPPALTKIEREASMKYKSPGK